MKKSLIVLLTLTILTVALTGCIQKKSEVRAEVISDCQCHTQPWNYKHHIDGQEYCLDCHKIEDHPKVERRDEYRIENLENCSLCHEMHLLRIHMPKTNCVSCHGDAKTIHEKYEKEFLEGEK